MTATIIRDKFDEILGVAAHTPNAIVNLLINTGKIDQFTRIISREAAPRYPFIITLGEISEDWETWLRNQPITTLEKIFYEFTFDTFKVIDDDDKKY